MKIGNLLNLAKENDNSGNRRLDRLEERRASWDRTFDRMQQEAIKEGDSEKVQKIFEMSEMMEEKLDTKLDKLEEKTGKFNWDRHLDNAFDKLQADAYESDDTEMAENIFNLSQVIKDGKFDSSKQLLLQKLMSNMLDAGGKAEVTAEAVGNSVAIGSGTGTSGTGTSGTGTSNTTANV